MTRGTLPGIGQVDQPTRTGLLALERRLDATDVTIATLGSIVYGIGMLWFTNTAPTGYQLLDGSAISRTGNPNLFALWGVTHGAGDGSTTFNVPDMRGVVPVGRDSGQTEFDTIGETGGAKTHTLSAAESGLPAHNHTQNAHTHTQNSHNHTQDAHNHTQNSHNHTQDAHLHSIYRHPNTGSSTGGGYNFPLYSGSGGSVSTYSEYATATNQAATATNQAATATNQAATATNQNTTATNNANTAAAASSAHNNLQPYRVVNFIVRLG